MQGHRIRTRPGKASGRKSVAGADMALGVRDRGRGRRRRTSGRGPLGGRRGQIRGRRRLLDGRRRRARRQSAIMSCVGFLAGMARETALHQRKRGRRAVCAEAHPSRRCSTRQGMFTLASHACRRGCKERTRLHTDGIPLSLFLSAVRPGRAHAPDLAPFTSHQKPYPTSARGQRPTPFSSRRRLTDDAPAPHHLEPLTLVAVPLRPTIPPALQMSGGRAL